MRLVGGWVQLISKVSLIFCDLWAFSVAGKTKCDLLCSGNVDLYVKLKEAFSSTLWLISKTWLLSQWINFLHRATYLRRSGNQGLWEPERAGRNILVYFLKLFRAVLRSVTLSSQWQKTQNSGLPISGQVPRCWQGPCLITSWHQSLSETTSGNILDSVFLPSLPLTV